MRTDGDVWDIVSSVGRTALIVAAFRALETNLPDPLIQDDYAALFVEAAGEPRYIEVLADPTPFTDTPFLPGFMGYRTRFFDEFFLSATASGVRQAVIVASGLDARAYRLDWPAGTTVFEIDQPKVLEFKQRVLTEHHAQPKADRRVVAVDLRDDWPAALLAAGFDTGQPAVWSAEGLLPYLPGAAQDALFERIHQLSGSGSRLGVENSVTKADFNRMMAVTSKYFDTNPFDDVDPSDLFYDDERADPIQWLTDNGWSVRTHTPVELSTAYGRSVAEIPEELIELWGRPRYLTAVR
ncbi:class I SAM-dependent methyltransferase [Nocardia sp. 004]|uniref:class I SAM-dependent methyltransferase n=1 Tax=Nocardia sp. 004 TaxID=3385978 RepID=UPI0039A05BCF